MMIIMRSNATDEQIDDIVRIVETNGLRAHLSRGVERTVIGAIGDGRPVDKDQFMYLPGVDRIVPISRPFKLASREFSPQDFCLPHRWDEHRRVAHRDHRRSVRSREPATAAGDRPRSARGRSARPARGRLQAAHLTLFIPGVGRRWPADLSRGTSGYRAAGCHRSHVTRAGIPGDAIRRCTADRSAQHAELLPTAHGG